jgi:hypothetical protein
LAVFQNRKNQSKCINTGRPSYFKHFSDKNLQVRLVDKIRHIKPDV